MNQVLSILTGKQVDSSVIDRGYCGNYQEYAGCYIKSDKVYSICNGVVLASEKDPKNDTYSVTVEVDSQCWVRYCYLSQVNVSAGAYLKLEDLVGYSTKNLTRLEYCTANESQFPVRILSKQLYKHDPTPIIFGKVNAFGVS